MLAPIRIDAFSSLISQALSSPASSEAPGVVPITRNFLACPPTGRYFSPALPSDCFAIDLPGRATSPGEGLPILFCLSLREWPRLPFTARIERPHPSQ